MKNNGHDQLAMYRKAYTRLLTISRANSEDVDSRELGSHLVLPTFRVAFSVLIKRYIAHHRRPRDIKNIRGGIAWFILIEVRALTRCCILTMPQGVTRSRTNSEDVGSRPCELLTDEISFGRQPGSHSGCYCKAILRIVEAHGTH